MLEVKFPYNANNFAKKIFATNCRITLENSQDICQPNPLPPPKKCWMWLHFMFSSITCEWCILRKNTWVTNWISNKKWVLKIFSPSGIFMEHGFSRNRNYRKSDSQKLIKTQLSTRFSLTNLEMHYVHHIYNL